jgi:hypothetical protein
MYNKYFDKYDFHHMFCNVCYLLLGTVFTGLADGRVVAFKGQDLWDVTRIGKNFESRSDEMYLIQHYVIKVVSDLRQRWRFFLGTLVFSTNKTDCYDITEILLKIALNTITLPYTTHCVRVYNIYFISKIVVNPQTTIQS